jgi:hypothetical protein
LDAGAKLDSAQCAQKLQKRQRRDRIQIQGGLLIIFDNERNFALLFLQGLVWPVLFLKTEQ